MQDLSNTHRQTYRKSSDHSGYFNYDTGNLRKAKLGLIAVPCVRSNYAFRGQSSGSGSRARFIRLGLNDIESRTKCQKVSFNSVFGVLNNHPAGQAARLRSLRDLLNVFNRL